ncbi:histidine/lysine/arginine/ornithine transporter subunit [Erwinia tracheiphila PSU-1]|nr:histidine/lysine/arginine/ornithine transporter subunit [Erwinia tracheiphila PSU-1]
MHNSPRFAFFGAVIAAQERAIRYLDKVGIDERVRAKYPVNLSGGQQQRVSITRALAMERKCCCLMNQHPHSILIWWAKY